MLNHLSYSSISTYLMCPRSWRFHYIERVEVPTATALVFGSAMHHTIEEHIKTHTATDRVPLVERWSWNWQAQLESNPQIAWGDDTPEGLSNEGVRILSDPDIAGLVDALQPLIDDKVHIEDYVELRVPGVPISIIGYIDIIEADGVPGDFKTSSKSWNHDRAQGEMQPAFYLAALNQNGYSLNPDLRFRHYIFVKTKTPKVQVIETQRTAGELLWLTKLIREVYEGINAQVFPPNPLTWKCSERWCEYWGMCRGKAL